MRKSFKKYVYNYHLVPLQPWRTEGEKSHPISHCLWSYNSQMRKISQNRKKIMQYHLRMASRRQNLLYFGLYYDWFNYNTIFGFMLSLAWIQKLVLDICSWQVSALNLEYIFLETIRPFEQKRRILKEKTRILIYKDGQLAIVGKHFV